MEYVLRYFQGEKLQCIIGIILALLFIGIAISFLTYFKTSFNKGMAYPFIIIPVLLLTICLGVVFKTNNDITRVNDYLNNGPAKIKTEEVPRMKTVMQNFKTIKIIEICITVGGLILFLLMVNNPFIKGIGLGLTIQGIVMYIFDVIAEKRGELYMDYLLSLQ